MGVGMGKSLVDCGRVGYLDALRGIAALIVVFSHVTKYNVVAPTGIGRALTAGHSAVCLFFVLSGFVLSYKYLGVRDCAENVITAIVKRPLRLAGVIIFALLLVIPELYIINPESVKRFFTGNWFVTCNALLPPLWTIGWELYGSFAVYMVLLVLRRQPFIMRLAVYLLLILFFREAYLLAFFFGMLAADCQKNIKLDDIPGLTMISFLALPPAIWLFSHDKMDMIFATYSSYCMGGAILIFVIALVNPWVQRVLSIRPLLWLGRVSFSLYVIHWLFTWEYFSFIESFFRMFGVSDNAVNAFSTASCIALSLIAAHFVTRYVDEPCIKLSGIIAERIVNPRPAAAVSPAAASELRDGVILPEGQES